MTEPIESKLLSDVGIYILMEDITDQSCEPAISYILEKNVDISSKRPKTIKLIINSRGGEATSAFSLIDIMLGSKIPVVTIGIGQICSSALLIFMSGQKRTLTPNTSILTHQYSWASWGKEHELIAARKEQSLLSERIFKLYKKFTGLDNKIIKEKLLCDSDTWLSAQEAKKYNLCDEIKDFMV
jgi:ATP-dependent Clp protease protease subunit